MKKSLAVILFLILSLSAGAQNWLMNLNYNIALPGSEMKQYINNPSFLGFSFDVRRFVSPSVTMGASFGQQLFYWQNSQQLELESTRLNGSQFRFMNAFPIMINSHFYFGDSGFVRPFVGLNMGGFYAWQRSELGIVVKEGRQWQWGVAPELGVMFPVGTMTMNVGTKMSYLATPHSSTLGDPPNQLYFGINVGVVFIK